MSRLPRAPVARGFLAYFSVGVGKEAGIGIRAGSPSRCSGGTPFRKASHASGKNRPASRVIQLISLRSPAVMLKKIASLTRSG